MIDPDSDRIIWDDDLKRKCLLFPCFTFGNHAILPRQYGLNTSKEYATN